MKLVQSTWFNGYDQIKGNWPDEKFALFSIGLSYHLLKRQGIPTCLYTNTIGFDVVVNLLGLKYDEVQLCLDRSELDIETNQLFDKYWSLHKLYTYSLQTEPFIHFDNDVYFFKKLDSSWQNATLVAQNKEIEFPYYTICLEEIQRHFTQIPTYLAMDSRVVTAVNTGISGGNRIDFFKLLYPEVIGLLTNNQSHLDNLTDGFANIFIEQCIMKNFADHLGIPFKYILPNTIDRSRDYRVNKFHLLPDKSDYIHVMNYKSNATICESIARMLHHTDKKLYRHCTQVAKSLQGVRHPSFGFRSYNNENDISSLLKHFFRRTYRISILLSDIPLKFESLEQLSESIYSIGKMVREELFDILLDAFVFELDRYEFFKKLDKKAIVSMYEIFTKSSEYKQNWKRSTIKLTNSVKFIESRWNWVEGNEFFEISPNQYLDNIKKPPGHFSTLIYYYPEQNIPKEHLLGICDTIIVKSSEETISIEHLINLVRQSLIDQHSVDFGEDHIVERIRFFIFQGVFSLRNKSLHKSNQNDFL